MKLELAVAARTDAPHESLCVARRADPMAYNLLGRPLLDLAREFFAGCPTVLVHRDGTGEVRAFGASRDIRSVVGVSLDDLRWIEVDVPERGE